MFISKRKFFAFIQNGKYRLCCQFPLITSGCATGCVNCFPRKMSFVACVYRMVTQKKKSHPIKNCETKVAKGPLLARGIIQVSEIALPTKSLPTPGMSNQTLSSLNLAERAGTAT